MAPKYTIKNQDPLYTSLVSSEVRGSRLSAQKTITNNLALRFRRLWCNHLENGKGTCDTRFTKSSLVSE